INGPRFSTKAESKFFRGIGADIIGMTQYPEVALARESSLCYLNIAIVTDYDSGLDDDIGIKPVSYEEVSANFSRSVDTVGKLIKNIVKSIDGRKSCNCKNAMKGAIIDK
ncbi:methylthioadenosine phosphorylase, partial [mine drainage metagenome]